MQLKPASTIPVCRWLSPSRAYSNSPLRQSLNPGMMNPPVERATPFLGGDQNIHNQPRKLKQRRYGMTRKHWIDLSPSLVVGVGIIASTLVAVLAAESGWLVLAGPLLLALTVVSADVLHSRLKRRSSGPSWAALLL